MTTTAPATRRSTGTILGIGAGNAMEWYDWNIYATFSAFFASQFFNSGDEFSDLLNTLAIFAVGFVARPFGGLVFGWIADKKGRKLSMALTVAFAAIGSLAIGLCPTYEQIGIGASIILLVARLGQGLAHGGELPSAQTYVAEVAPKQRRGLWSSLIYASGTVGVVAGMLIGALLAVFLNSDQMTAYGWRIPFIIGGVFGLFALVMRARMHETEVFLDEQEDDAAHTEHESMWHVIKTHPRLLAQVIGLTMGATVIYYIWAVSAPAYAIEVRGVSEEGALWAGVGANLIFFVTLPLWGALSDRIGRRPCLLIMLLGLAIVNYPLNQMIGSSAWQLFAAMSVALLFMGGFSAVGPAVYAEIFPTRIRAVGLGVPYSLAVAAFGGTAPYLQAKLADMGHPQWFIGYAIVLLVLSAALVLTVPETRGIDLESDEVGAYARRG